MAAEFQTCVASLSRGNSYQESSYSSSNSIVSTSTKPMATSENPNKNMASTQMDKLAAYSKQLKTEAANKINQLCEGIKQKGESLGNLPLPMNPFQDHDVTGIIGAGGCWNTYGDVSMTPPATLRQQYAAGPFYSETGSTDYVNVNGWLYAGRPLSAITEEEEEEFPWDREPSMPFDSAGVQEPSPVVNERVKAPSNNRKRGLSPNSVDGRRRSLYDNLQVEEKDWDHHTVKMWEKAKHQDQIFDLHVAAGSRENLGMKKEDVGGGKPGEKKGGCWAKIKRRFRLGGKKTLV